MDASIEIVEPDVGRPFRAFAHAGKSFPNYWHQHAEYELTYGNSHSGELHVGDVVETLSAPQVLLLGPQIPHAWIETQPFEHLVVQFRRDWLGANFLRTVGCERLLAVLDRSAVGLVVTGQPAEAIAAAMRAMLPLTGVPAITAMLTCLELFAAAEAREILVSGSTAGVDARLQVVTEWIDRNATDDIALADAAAAVDMHPQAFARYFHRASGHSFVGYLGHVRVRHACLLLREGGLGITEVAMRVGFGTVANFNRTFLRLRRMNPSEYCRRFRS